MFNLINISVNKKSGFTLVELIVVIAIISILAAVIIPHFIGFQEKAKSTQATVDAKQVAMAADGLIIENEISDGSSITKSAVAELAGVPESNIISPNIVNTSGVAVFTYKISKYQSIRSSDGRFTTTIE